MRRLAFLLGLALLAGLAACAGRPGQREQEQEQEEQVLSVTAPAEEDAAPAAPATPAGELPEPQEESPEVSAGAAQPSASEAEPAVSGQKSARALPEPRPPAEPKKAPAKKAATKPAKSAKDTKAAASAPADASAKPPAAEARPPAAGTTSPASAEAAVRAPDRREVLARKGDTVVLDLEGRGWLLLPGDRRGISFLGAESGPQRTSFSFKALELGEYDLAFQLQDNARGAATGEVVRLRVLPEEKLRELLAAGQAASSASPAGQPGAAAGLSAGGESADPARLQKAERLFAGGFYDLALPEYLAVYREADPLLNDRLAAIYLAKGEAAAAAKFYDRNLSAGAPYGGQAVIGLVRAGLAMASPELVLQHLPALLELPPAQTQAELLDVAGFAISQGRYPLALELLSEYLRRHPRGSGLDTVYFQLARIYELESPLRDVRLAREYYRKVYEEFPESEHAAKARERILYLDRHFFHVQ